MIESKETEIILNQFFGECINFWKHNGKTGRESFENALNDIKSINRNPYEPHGDLLDVETKQKFIEYRTMDLGWEVCTLK